MLYSTTQEQIDNHSQVVKLNSRFDSQKFWELRFKLRKIMSLLLDYLSRSKLDEQAPLRYVLLYSKKGIDYQVQVAVWCIQSAIPFLKFCYIKPRSTDS